MDPKAEPRPTRRDYYGGLIVIVILAWLATSRTGMTLRTGSTSGPSEAHSALIVPVPLQAPPPLDFGEPTNVHTLPVATLAGTSN
jgi:hypothetical protein